MGIAVGAVFAQDPAWRAPAAKQAHIDAAHRRIRFISGLEPAACAQVACAAVMMLTPHQRHAFLRFPSGELLAAKNDGEGL